MKLRRVLFSLAILAFAFVLFACGGKELKISFESNGGSEVAEIAAKAGAEITKPADPTKSGVTFGGWYADIDLTEKYDFPATMPEESITLYAKWVVTLTFDSKGGPAIDPIVAEGGKTFKMPADPVRDGYVFVGWFTDEAFTKQLTYVMPKTNTTAYAKWQVLETGSAVTVPMTFTDNDGCYLVSEEADGIKFTATAGKDTYSYVIAPIPCGVRNNNTVVVELIGTKGTNVILKVEGGNAESATEVTVEMTGENQKVIWSDEAKKFSSVGGAGFLVFLNGGTAGCGETPEYVKIKSVKLYRTVDAGATQKSAIYFAVNGGDEIEEYYDVAGTAVTAPADPERGGYVFKGWFADKDFTTPYEFTTIPAEGAVVFAKWEKSKKIRADISVLGEPNILDAGTYEARFNNDLLVFKKTATGGEWNCFTIAFPEGADLNGYDHFLVSIAGPKGAEILFKINDNGALEKRVTLDGSNQTFEFAFDQEIDTTKPAVTIFATPEVAGESGEFTIAYLAYADHQTIFNAMDGEFEYDEDPATTLVKKDGTLVLKKESKAGKEWDCVKIKIAGDLSNCNYVQFIVKGTAGERMLIKPFDGQDMFVDLTGSIQVVYLPITAAYDSKKASVVLFANPNADGTGNEITIYQAYLLALFDESQAGPSGDYDLLTGELNPLHESLSAYYEIDITKPVETNDPDWKCAVVELEDPDYEGLNKLIVTVKGTAGEEIMFKINDNGGQLEKKVQCTGEVQELEFDFEHEFDDSKFALVIFANPGAAGTGHAFAITKLQYTDGNEKVIDLLLDGKFRSLDEGVYQIEKKLVIKKGATGTGYEAILVDIKGDFSEYYGIKYSVKGANGQKILFKINDQNDGETWLDLTGEVQTGILTKLPANYQAGNVAIVLFPDGGTAGTGQPIEIYELTFLKEAPAE